MMRVIEEDVANNDLWFDWFGIWYLNFVIDFEFYFIMNLPLKGAVQATKR